MNRRLINISYVLLGGLFANISSAQELTVHKQYTVGDQPRAIVSADFNGDSFPDFATANFGEGTISVLLSNGPGEYFAANSYPTGETPSATPMALVTANFTNDESPDLLVINKEETSATLFENDSTGIFTPFASFDIGSTPVHVITGQFNQTTDSHPDILIVNRDTNELGRSPSVRLLLNDGNGTFTLRGTYDVDQSPEYAITADFNGDTFPDVVVANNRAKSISFLAGDGAGNFATAVHTDLPFRPLKIGTGDFNKDGHLDIVGLHHIGADFFTYLPGKGDGSFIAGKGEGDFDGQDAVTLRVGHTPSAIAPHDYNRDGNLDIAIGHLDSHNLLFIKGHGDGRFSLDESYYGVGNGPVDFVLADINEDAIPDIISTNINGNTVSTIINNGDGTLHTLRLRPINSDFHNILSADFNGDSLPDLATIKPNSGNIEIKIRKFSNTFSPTTAITLPFIPEFITAGDINASGRDDLLANDGQQQYATMISNVNGSFQTLEPIQARTLELGTDYKLAQMHSTDFDGDNFSELVIVETNNSQIAYLKSSDLEDILPGDLQLPTTPVGKEKENDDDPEIINRPNRLVVNDFNNDDTPDLIALNPEARTLTQLFSLPQGDAAPEPLATPSTTDVIPFPINSVNSSDYNADTLPDILLGRSDSHEHLLFSGNINGSFDSAVPYTTDLLTTQLTTGDFNGDGIPDIISLVDDDSTLITLLGNGDGSFKPGMQQPFGSLKTLRILSSDIDGDPFTDIILATSDRRLRFMINNGEGGFTTNQIRNSSSTVDNLIEFTDHFTGIKKIISSSQSASNAATYTDQGGGVYSVNERSPNLGAGSYGLAAKDMNSDQIIDLISIDKNEGQITILQGTDNNTYLSGATKYVTGDGPISLAVEDFDNDSFYDVATANDAAQSITIVKGIDINAEEQMLDPSQTTTINLFATPIHMISLDINQDGLFDLAVLLKEPAAMQIYMNQGDMNFEPSGHPIPVGPEPKHIYTDDVNLDGGSDFIISARQISVLLNQGKFMPSPFKIKAVTGQLTNSEATSAPIPIIGIPNGSAQVKIVNGSYSLDGVTFTTRDGAAYNFDAIHVRTNTAASAATTSTATLIVGGYSDTFSATTIADGTLPGEFSFEPKFNKPLSQLDPYDDTRTRIISEFILSDPITITGLTHPANISLTPQTILLGRPEPTTEVEIEAFYSINEQEFTKEAGVINNNDSIVVRLASSHEYETMTYATITIGGVSAAFNVTTQTDTEPDFFRLPDRSDLLPRYRYISPWITVSGITAPTTISIKNGFYDTDLVSDGYTDKPSLIDNGRAFRILTHAPSTYDTPLDVTVTVGGIDTTFTIRTRKNPNIAAAEEQALATESIKQQSLLGCSLSANRSNVFDPTLPALVIISAIVLWRRRKGTSVNS